MGIRKQPAYMGKTTPPLSDGRTPGVCSWCGKQHLQSQVGCWDEPSAFPRQRFIDDPKPKGAVKCSKP